MTAARTQLARDLYHAFAEGDREAVDRVLAEGFTFSSPVDVGLDRVGYISSAAGLAPGNTSSSNSCDWSRLAPR